MKQNKPKTYILPLFINLIKEMVVTGIKVLILATLTFGAISWIVDNMDKTI